ncbi:MAG: hypothetical protein Q8N77_04675 [Nanoarchaeota archaeon]|nr:hypothetical protein [Nanoarchaeota archaeon]
MPQDYRIYVEKLNSSPIFTRIAKDLDYQKIGLQIMDEEEIVKEYTSHSKNGKIVKLEEGINDPELTIKIDEETIKKITSSKEQAWIQKHPVEAAIKYAWKIDMPLIVKLRLLKLLSNI